MNVLKSGQSHRSELEHGSQTPTCQQPADGRTQAGQDQALQNQLADDAKSIRSQRSPDGELPRPTRGSGEQQIGDVRTGYQQHEAYRAKQDVERTFGAA